MKKVTTWFALIVVGLFIGCSKDDDNNQTINPDPGIILELVHTAQIGSGGGQLIVEDFELSIPQGSFPSEHVVKLYKFPVEANFSDNEASVFYKLTGIPIDYSQALDIKVKTNTGLSESTFIALGEMNYISSLSSTAMGFQLLPSSQEEDWVTTKIPLLEIDSKGAAEETELTFGAVTGYKESDSKGHFKIHFPKGLEDKAAKLNQYLEEAYDFFKSEPLGFSYDARTSWPVSVTIKKMDVFGFYENSKLGNNWGFMMFNRDKLDDEAELRITAGHEFFHLVQSLYDPRFGYTKAVFPGEFVWFDEAAATWAEEKFTNIGGYASVTRNSTNRLAVFNGAQKGAAENPADHGYGMSTLIKYLVNKPNIGEGFLVKVYEKLFAGTSNPVSAVNASLPDPMLLDNYYGDLIDDYMQGYVYGDVSHSAWIGARDGALVIASPNDSMKVFESDYPHYSANIYQIKLQNPEFTEEQSMSLKVSGGSGRWLHVYKYNSSDLVKVDQNYDELILPDIKTLKESGWNLLAVVVNTNGSYPYNGTDKINLDMHVQSVDPIDVEFESYDMELYIMAHMDRGLNGDTVIDDVGLGYSSSLTYSTSIGNLDGNIYTAEWDDVFGGSHRSVGHFTFILDFENQKIVSGEIVSKRYTINYNDSTISTCSIQNVPLIDQSATHYKFGVLGSDVSNHITDFTYIEYCYPSNSWENTALDYFSDEESYFELLLGWEEDWK